MKKMKRIACLLLTALLICALFTGCGKKDKLTATEELNNLFTTIDLMDATVSSLEEEMEAGNVTSERLTQMYIDRIEAYDAKLGLNSVIAINPGALDDARALDKEREEGKTRGPLHGIPVIVKANLDVKGMATTAGANALADMIADKDSFAVKQLRDAGAVILAQANMSEFAFSAINSRSTFGGITRNPYDIDKTPGGSSGGTAVAITCNFAAAGVGTDTGGSIRNPSSFNNLYGIRPSKGLVSASGILPYYLSKDTAGPMARTAEDMALMLEIMAGSDKNDDYTLEADADALLGDGYSSALQADSLKGMRIGYLENSLLFMGMYGGESLFVVQDEKISDMVNNTIANLRKAGAELVNISEELTSDTLESLKEGIEIETFEYDLNKYLNEKGDAAPYKTLGELAESGTYNVTQMNLNWISIGGDDYAESFEKTKNPYTETVGSYKRDPSWKKMLAGREFVSKVMKDNNLDAVFYLNFFDVAQKELQIVDDKNYNHAEYDMVFGPLFGLPEISLPMGFSNAKGENINELPLGLSIFADFGQEEKLIKIAGVYEKQAGDSIRRSPDLTPALEDEALTAFLSELLDKAYSIDSGKAAKKCGGKYQLMLAACEKAVAVDTKDVYATYEAALTLAEAYDNVKANL